MPDERTPPLPEPERPPPDPAQESAPGEPIAVPTQPSGTARLVSAGAVMAGGTAVSRLLGFGRLALLVVLFGNGTRQAEMFTIANTVPNSMYILLAGGVLNTVLVPQIVRAIKGHHDGGEAYTHRIMTLGLLVLAAVTVLLTLAVPWIIALYSAPGWKSPQLSAQYDSMVLLGYYCMPQVFFYGVHVLAGQVLNARDRFGPMMWAPIANNVVSIAVLLLYLWAFGLGDTSQAFTSEQVLLLGVGSTLGIVAQAAVLVPYLGAAGYHYRPKFDFRGTGLRHTASLAKWTILFVLVNQLALVVINRLASSATVGGRGAGITAYSNAYAMWILPHSLVTVSVGTAMLTSASAFAHAGDLAGVRDETTRAMRLTLTALLPASVAFVALGVPIARLAFGFGQGAKDADYVGWALVALAVGLVPFTLQYLLLRSFYAVEQNRTTFWIQVVIASLNVVLAAAWVFTIQRPSLVATGVSAAYSAAYVVGFVLSFVVLRRRLPGLTPWPLVRLGVRLFVASVPAAAVALLVTLGVEQLSSGQLARALGLAAGGALGLVTFLLMSRLLHIREVTQAVSQAGGLVGRLAGRGSRRG